MASSPRVLPFFAAKPVSLANSPASARRAGDLFSLNGPSPAMAKLWSQIQRVAPHFRTALLTGEAGTGAESAARALHEASPFYDRPLRALPAADVEKYFDYGGPHVRNPTNEAMYLPEVEQLSPAAQNALIRLVRLRGERAGCVIVHTRHDLRALVSSGCFSSELAASFSALRLALPSLRERPEDIPCLLQGVTARLARQLSVTPPVLADDFIDAASDFAWPRNLDQMHDLVRWLMNHRPGTLHAADFADACASEGPQPAEAKPAVRLLSLNDVVQEHLRAVLFACNGNKLRAAEVLGISRSTLYRMLDTAAPSGLLARAG